MSLDKAIAPRKSGARGREWRKPYRGEKAVDHTCRNRGGCPECKRNRTYANRKRLLATLDRD